ncbi:unnamed protein product [Prunus armeniaca]
MYCEVIPHRSHTESTILSTRVRTIPNPQSEKEKSFAAFQEGYRKDVERGVARMLDEEVLWNIMMTCIILHNMIVEDEYDYDVSKVFEPDSMNTALTRIYERPMRPNGQPIEHKLLIRESQD